MQTYYQGRTQGRGFGGRNPSHLEAKTLLLMDDIVRELPNDNIHSGSDHRAAISFEEKPTCCFSEGVK